MKNFVSKIKTVDTLKIEISVNFRALSISNGMQLIGQYKLNIWFRESTTGFFQVFQSKI